MEAAVAARASKQQLSTSGKKLSGAAAMNAAGEKVGGRPAGSANVVTKDLRALIMEAMEIAGDPKKGGREGALKYLVTRAKKTPNAFLALVNKMLPAEVKAEVEQHVTYVIKTGVPDGE